MLLALAFYASTAHANVPHYDLDLLYHDGRAHRLGQAPPHLAPSVSPPRRTLAWHVREREHCRCHWSGRSVVASGRAVRLTP